MSSTEAPFAFSLDRRRMRESFERASARYESTAVLQARINDDLLERLEEIRIDPRVVLDLGAGTGRGARELKQRYRKATVIALDIAPGMLREARRNLRTFRKFERVCGDALRLPLRDASVDLVFSNLMLQWCDDLHAVFTEVRRVLTPDGLFAFTTFGPDTLCELRAAWAATDGYSHVNRFIDMHDIGDAVMRAGLTEPVLDVDRIRVTYPDVFALMRDLKAIGAHNVTEGRPRGLTGRARLRKMTEAYERFRIDGLVPATYEVVFGVAWGSTGRHAHQPIESEALIPVSSIRRRGTR